MSALANQPDIELYVLELASLGLHEWKLDRDSFPFPLSTLWPGSLAELNNVDLTEKIHEYLREVNPDVLIVTGYARKEMRQAMAWAIKNGCPVLVFSESTEQDRRRWPWQEWLKSRVVRRFEGAVAAGPPQAAYLQKLGLPPERVAVVGNVVDNAFFAKKSEEARREAHNMRALYGLPNSYFLYVGRFSREKNLLRLLKAYQSYRSVVGKDAWELVLAGSGPDEQRLCQWIADRKIEGVHLPGFQQLDTLPIYYGLASVFVLASISEPWGLVVNEAMASGLPVLISDRCGCLSSLLQEGVNGFSFDPYDIEELADLMIACTMGCYDLTSMGRASTRVIAEFTPEAYAKRMAAHIHKITGLHDGEAEQPLRVGTCESSHNPHVGVVE
jgi:glycosyltransferase involved in cell wall biosynthesis